MKKLLWLEAVILLALLAVAIVIRAGMGKDTPGEGNLLSTQAPSVSQPAPTQTLPVIGPSVTIPATESEPTWMTTPEDRQLLAQQYFVYDCEQGEFTILSGAENERIYPASITKLFTAYVALQYLEPDQKITAGDALDMVVPGSSVAKIQRGDILTVEQLVEAMLLPSGNDAAYILAVEAGRILDGKPQEYASVAAATFVAHMNDQAAALGMHGTHFMNPDGIHKSEHYSTPTDLVKMAELALQDPTILEYAITSKETVQLGTREPVEWKNTNELVDPESEYYCPYAVGLKTGQTPYAGSCLLSAFVYHDRTVIIGVFGCPEKEDRFGDTLQLFDQYLGR